MMFGIPFGKNPSKRLDFMKFLIFWKKGIFAPPENKIRVVWFLSEIGEKVRMLRILNLS